MTFTEPALPFTEDAWLNSLSTLIHPYLWSVNRTKKFW